MLPPVSLIALSISVLTGPTLPCPTATGVLDQIVAQRATNFTCAERWTIARTIEATASEVAIEPTLVLAVMHVESTFKKRQRSGAGALGLMQIMPSTGEALTRRYDMAWRGPSTLYDPATNIELGVRYLRRLIDYFDGDLTLALTAYCHGPGRVRRWLATDGLTPRRLRYSRKIYAAKRPLDETYRSLTPAIQLAGRRAPDHLDREAGAQTVERRASPRTDRRAERDA